MLPVSLYFTRLKAIDANLKARAIEKIPTPNEFSTIVVIDLSVISLSLLYGRGWFMTVIEIFFSWIVLISFFLLMYVLIYVYAANVWTVMKEVGDWLFTKVINGTKLFY